MPDSADATNLPDPERQRLAEADDLDGAWRKWGPWLSERQWGTVREDYSPDGDAWDSFPHDAARSRAYRWGEDGIAGFCDRTQQVCLGLALWNGHDPILKERLFGLTNSQGNHGEDVKEQYFFLDAAPTGSYLRMLYRYPHAAFPYEDLVKTNAARSAEEREYEILDTGVFDEQRYFDVFVEYAKSSEEQILMRIEVINRGAEAAKIHVIPQIWFRNTWSWGEDNEKPSLQLDENHAGAVLVEHPEVGRFRLESDASPATHFCENETNFPRVFNAESRPSIPRTRSTTRSSTGRRTPRIRRTTARRPGSSTSSNSVPASHPFSGSGSIRRMRTTETRRSTTRSHAVARNATASSSRTRRNASPRMPPRSSARPMRA